MRRRDPHDDQGRRLCLVCQGLGETPQWMTLAPYPWADQTGRPREQWNCPRGHWLACYTREDEA